MSWLVKFFFKLSSIGRIGQQTTHFFPESDWKTEDDVTKRAEAIFKKDIC